MKVFLIAGNIADARADAICTSTNPRLSLFSGTGGAVRDKGGREIKRSCEAILDRGAATSGKRALPLGSAHVTTAGSLAAKIVIHCVASNAHHRSSEDVIRACVRNALAKAAAEGCASVAMPVFGAGHAAFPFARAVAAMTDALRAADTPIDEVTIVVADAERAKEAAAIVEAAFPKVVDR